MTTKQIALKKSLIRQVHTSPRYKNHYAEERAEYELLLLEHFGVSTSKEMEIDQLMMLSDYLNMRSTQLGKKFKTKTTYLTVSQLWKIEQLWKEKARDKSTPALLQFVKRIIRVEYKELNRLKIKEARKVIIALEKMKER